MLLKIKVQKGKGSEFSSIKKDSPVDLGAYSWEGKAISKYLYATIPNLCKYESG